METLSFNTTKGKPRRVVEGGVEYLVTHATSIVPGVLHGSRGALFYPPQEVKKSVRYWDGMPLTLDHPYDEVGNPVHAKWRGVPERQWLGHLRNSHVTDDGKLKHECWFNVSHVKRLSPYLLNLIQSGKPVEVSTGLHTDNIPAQVGATHNGRPFEYVATNYRPDHLAVLLNERGACSIQDGCGLAVNKNGDGKHELMMKDMIDLLSTNSFASDDELVEMLPVTNSLTVNKDRFHRPENYDKVKDLPGGKQLWAGANDWENGWTWAGIHGSESRDSNGYITDPEKWIEVDHSKCPGCHGTLEANNRKDARTCMEYGKQQVAKWAGVTLNAAPPPPLPPKPKKPAAPQVQPTAPAAPQTATPPAPGTPPPPTAKAPPVAPGATQQPAPAQPAQPAPQGGPTIDHLVQEVVTHIQETAQEQGIEVPPLDTNKIKQAVQIALNDPKKALQTLQDNITTNCGGPGGTRGPCKSGEGKTKTTDTKDTKDGEKKDEGEKKGTMGRLWQGVKDKWNALRGRYGLIGATAVMAAWATPIFGTGPAATGAAEGIRAIIKHYSSNTPTEGDKAQLESARFKSGESGMHDIGGKGYTPKGKSRDINAPPPKAAKVKNSWALNAMSPEQYKKMMSNNTDTEQVAECFVTLLHAATSAHILHLQTRSFAAHMALDGLYKDLPGLVDDLIEAYQGKYGIVTSYPSGYISPSQNDNPEEFVRSLILYLSQERDSIGDDSELQNIVDEILGVLDGTAYKLRFLS